jgi:hypothetical protein
MSNLLNSLKKQLNFYLSFSLIFISATSSSQSIVSVQNQAGFVICTKTGEIYSVNANTGTTKLLTTAPSAIAINSLVSDTARGIIYYCYNNYISSNRAVYGYNYRTNTHFTLINDFAAAPGSPMVGLGGVGTAGAAFHNGFLYFGVELARTLSPGVPNIGANVPYTNRIYKVTLDGPGTSITATSLVKDFYDDNGFVYYSSTAYGNNVTSFYRYDHNWGDFVIINDTIFDRAVKGYPSGSFYFEQYTGAYDLNTPAAQLYNTLTLPATTILNDGFSYVQTASDGLGNLVFVGNEGNTNQFFVIADKTNGSYNVANARPLTLNGAAFAQAVTDCGNVLRGEGLIGNTVWYDENENGIKDPVEIGISNAPVELWEDIDANGIIDSATDKLLGTAQTDNDGHYGFVNMMQGNYLLRCIRTLSVNYPEQGFSASYPSNPLALSPVRLIDAGDETTAGANNTNLLNRSFSSIVFNDQTDDFGFADLFGTVPLSSFNLKGIQTNKSVQLSWELQINGNEATYSIERSSDGRSYLPISTGVINTSHLKFNAVNWDHNIPISTPQLFYRLKLTDKNGVIKRSSAVKVKLSGPVRDQVTVFPNPAKNRTTLLIPAALANKTIHITFTNSFGQLFRKFVIRNAQEIEILDITGITPGTYYWKIDLKDKKQLVYSGKLEIQ